MAIGKEGNVKWVDGLRGVGSSLVVATHVARGFDEGLFDPAMGENGSIRFLQLPIFRIFVQGRMGVAIFSMVTGYVCALKPIKLSREGNQESALKSMTKSALRRPPRLVLPTTISTFLVWLVAQFGAFAVAKHSSGWWVNSSSPKMFDTLQQSVGSMLRNMITTWTRASNSYEVNQWTLLPLLQGSMKIYVFMVATCYMAPRYRMMAALAMFTFYGFANDPYFNMQFFWGAFLAEFQNHPVAIDFVADRPKASRLFAFICLAFGLIFASMPERHFSWALWSNALKEFLTPILPKDPNYGRWSTSIGLWLISLAIHFSPLARNVLSNKYFLWLGKQSFAVYLIHGTLIRTVLCWMLFGFAIPENTTNDEGEVVVTRYPSPSGPKLLICASIWLPLVYGLAVVWTTFVDPWCAKVTEKMVSFTKQETDEKPLLPTR
ncbi:hypothetical protein MKZ38_005416 [Zalerion maritima]|uniref:Acyltransferase 3 domain-containing protein n=1 Tax=Zalerion maritima TaxID=339359 RepID=A0AAD5WR03_9PEZI|nr:hypothetical protein MKZ38_005416 [Zalerion maritima]